MRSGTKSWTGSPVAWSSQAACERRAAEPGTVLHTGRNTELMASPLV